MRHAWMRPTVPSLRSITSEVVSIQGPPFTCVNSRTQRCLPQADSEAAKGELGDKKGSKPQLSAEAIAMQQMMRGIHF